MKKSKENSILRIEAFGFLLLTALSWLTEAIRIPHFLFGETFDPNWHRALLRTVVIILIWGWVHAATKRLLKRLHYLEEFLRICSWCRKVDNNGEWLELEKYYSSKFATPTTHGMCPDCLNKHIAEIKGTPSPSSSSGDK